jgi:predicted enzyme related to lactoylglutathione lyase
MTAAVWFDWHELQTRDCARALRFYQALSGWTVEASPGGPRERHLCALDGQALGAVTISQAPPHVPAFWLPFLAVADLDATVARAGTLGARLLREPTPLPGAGRPAVALDPRGAVFGLRAAGAAAAPQEPAPGAFCWDELLTDDAESSATFYAALTGCSSEAVDLGPLGTYRILVSDGRRIAGVMKHPENAHPHWLPYLGVRGVDDETRRAVALGASLYFPPRDVPGAGRISGVDDPTGAGVCLMERGAAIRGATSP